MKKERPKAPFIPAEALDTIRKANIAALELGPCSARDISAAVRIPEREVSAHLEHIRKSLIPTTRQLKIVPAECAKCGFVFAKREKLRRPGKCPVCKSESIQEPRFAIEKKQG